MRLFASYSRKDADRVQELIADLQQARLSIWHDHELRGGDPWWQDILEQIRRCDVFLLALSNNSLRSKPCLSELSYARALGLPILPVQIGPVDHLRTTPVADIQVVDYRERTVPNGLRLMAAVQQAAGLRRPLPDPLPKQPLVPFAYLVRLGSAISAAQLTPDEQADFISQLRECLETEEDEGVREDARSLLLALRHRPDVTYRNAREIDRLLPGLDDVEPPPVADVGREPTDLTSPHSDPGAGRNGSAVGAHSHLHRLRTHPSRRTAAGAVVLVAILIVAAVLLTVLPGTSGAPPSASSGSPSLASSSASVTTPTPTPTPTPSVEGVFSGRTSTAGIGLSVVVDRGDAIAYVCDGQKFEVWLKGTVSGDEVQMTGADGESMSGTMNAQGLSGVITTAALQIPFLAAVAGPPAGVYRAEIQLNGKDAYITWAVVSPSLQLGVIDTDDGGLPAPPLDLDTGNFTLNGVAYHADLLPADAPLSPE